MKYELEDTFRLDYPALSRYVIFELTNAGWYDILRDMFEEIDVFVKKKKIKLHITNVREFNGHIDVSFYPKQYDDQIKNIVAKYKEISFSTCERCGSHKITEKNYDCCISKKNSKNN